MTVPVNRYGGHVRAVLFDLDGTLLEIDLEDFLHRYFQALDSAVGRIAADGIFLSSLSEATRAMMSIHPGRTNETVFWSRFEQLTGVAATRWRPELDRFYAQEFPALRASARPTPGARRAIETALELGFKVAIATNPIFPRVAVDARLSWAGLEDVPVHAVTTYETMEACKPLPAYFEQTASMIGCAPSECLMVGDDRSLDLPASAVGMRTFYVGSDAKAAADHRGSLEELPALLTRLAGHASV
jgi:FMN phosphatase YigB (HAD superfamily)